MVGSLLTHVMKDLLLYHTVFISKYKASVFLPFSQVKISVHLCFCNYQKALMVLMYLFILYQYTNRDLDDNNIDSTIRLRKTRKL